MKSKKVTIAEYIMLIFTVAIIAGACVMIGWGLFNKPLGTILFLAGTSAIAAFFWALHVLIEEDVKNL